MTNTEFTIEAEFRNANIAIAVRSNMVQQIVDQWNEQWGSIDLAKLRSEAEQLVVNSLMHETHRDPKGVDDVAAALVWLTFTGPFGDALLPHTKERSMRLKYVISRLGPKNFNFRLTVDEATKKALLLTVGSKNVG